MPPGGLAGATRRQGGSACTYDRRIQGYLAHKKLRPPRNLQYDYAWGPMVVLGGGLFIMSEVPL